MRANEPVTTSQYSSGASILNIILGIWTLVSPAALGFSRSPNMLWNTIVVGIVVIVLAGIQVSTRRGAALGWINFLLGLWLIVTGFAFGMGMRMNPAFFWNQLIDGIVIAIVSIWSTVKNPTVVTP